MARSQKRLADIGFSAISIEGGLISPDQVARVAGTTPDLKTAAEYGCPKGVSLRDEVTRYFQIGKAHWKSFAALDQPNQEQTEEFVSALLTDAFGFRLVKSAVHVRGDRRFAITFEAIDGRVPIVVTPPLAPDEAKSRDAFTVGRTQFGDGANGRIAKRSAGLLLQDWLNTNPNFYWGLVFAGDRVRLMRDNASFTRPAFIEADLGAIFRDDMFAEFTAWWLLTHASRFGKAGAPPSEAALERWREAGMQAGTAARDRLRGNVEAALLALGEGLLRGNPELRRKIDDNELSVQGLFEQMLRTVYRIIFLAVAEDRGLLHAPNSSREVRQLYRENYGFGFLRERAARRGARDNHCDAWEGLKIVFKGLGEGQAQLGLPALGGIFASDATPALSSAAIANKYLLDAIFNLGWMMEDGRRVRINWRDMATEEFGSVYEGLLELTPTRADEGKSFSFLENLKGNARKTSGSYYTPDSLVQTLLDSALDPVLERAEREGSAEAILNLRIIDPACGSGHFLLGAARRLATRVAQLRDADAPDYSLALRDVVARCIHGVDRNPMAVELAKVALWIESVSPGQPLGFLDANIRCGDALLGVFDLDALSEGIPDDAYKPLTGDVKDAAAYYKKKNKDEKKGQGSFDFDSGTGAMPPHKLAANLSTIRRMSEDTVGQVEKKREAFDAWRHNPERWATKVACDLYMAAFLLPKTEVPATHLRGIVPTTADVRQKLAGGNVYGPLEGAGVDAARAAGAFHWPLEFPDVIASNGGFDVVLGNPPWDTMSPDVKEFFSKYDPEIRFLSPEDQKERLAELLTDQTLAGAWQRNQDELYRAANFLRNSGRFTLFAEGNLGKGDFNIYRMFTELAFFGVRSGGVAAQIIPENFYNGANAAALRSHVFANMQLSCLITFENTRRVWFDIHAAQKFCMYAAVRGGTTQTVPAVFGINSQPKLAAVTSPLPFQIPLSLIHELSPAALAIPEFADPRDVTIARKLHARLPSFGANIPSVNQRVYMREIDMGNDRESFGEAADGIPLFEGRMVEAFDYRAKAYVSGRGRQADWKELEFGQPDKRIAPQWRIALCEIPEKLDGLWQNFRIGFCDVASPSNSRALVSAMIPGGVVCGHKVPTLNFVPTDDLLSLFWLGIANSFALDFLARQKVALTMSYTIVDSLPLPRRFDNSPVALAIVAHSARLACAGPEMAGLWARVAPMLGLQLEPAEDPLLRRRLRAELDVFVARDFFGLNRDEMQYLLDPSSLLGDDCGIETFGALKRAEMRGGKPFTSYEMIMDAWERLDAPR